MTAVILSNWVGERGMPAAVAALNNNKSALDIVQSGIEVVEADPQVAHVGLGGAVNMLGALETDAAIMDGDSLNVGCIGALQGYLNTVWVARKVLDLLPHTMLVGCGAARFAAECAAKKCPVLPDKVLEDYKTWRNANLPENATDNMDALALAKYSWPNKASKSEKDTAIFLAINSNGSIAVATSTSGWDYKYPGRLGDSPIIGAGLYADSRYGACACTHTGEMTMRTSAAHSVVLYMKMGAAVQDACHEAAKDLARLNTGYIGPVVIHAIDNQGQYYVLTTDDTLVNFCIWNSETQEIQLMPANTTSRSRG